VLGLPSEEVVGTYRSWGTVSFASVVLSTSSPEFDGYALVDKQMKVKTATMRDILNVTAILMN
jgi:hypothetical protein